MAWYRFQISTCTCQYMPKSKLVTTMLTTTDKLIWNISTVGFGDLIIGAKIYFLHQTEASSTVKQYKMNLRHHVTTCVCVPACVRALTVTGMSLQQLRRMFNCTGSKTLHYKRADRMEGRKSKGEQEHNPSSCELCVAVRQCCKDKFNLVRGFSPLSGWLYFVNV